MTRIVQGVAVLLCSLMLTACVLHRDVSGEFDKSVKNYNKMLRWQEVANAGALFIEPEGRDAFQSAADSLKKRGLSITDYRVLTTECLPDKGTGTAVTEFDYFILPSNRIKTLTYKQEWVYREINEQKAWRLKSGLPLFD